MDVFLHFLPSFLPFHKNFFLWIAAVIKADSRPSLNDNNDEADDDYSEFSRISLSSFSQMIYQMKVLLFIRIDVFTATKWTIKTKSCLAHRQGKRMFEENRKKSTTSQLRLIGHDFSWTTKKLKYNDINDISDQRSRITTPQNFNQPSMFWCCCYFFRPNEPNDSNSNHHHHRHYQPHSIWTNCFFLFIIIVFFLFRYFQFFLFFCKTRSKKRF